MRMTRFLIPLATAAALIVGIGSVHAQAFKVLVFTNASPYIHGSIPSGVAAVQQIAASNNFSVTIAQSANVFTDTNLAQFRAVIFLVTQGDGLLDGSQQGALQRFIRAGNGYVGVHSASDTEKDWPWYVGLVGASFAYHGASGETKTLIVENHQHQSTYFLPANWVQYDEWYVFNSNPRPRVNVLMRVKPLVNQTPEDQPISWYHQYDGGRSWYTGAGHTEETFADPLFRRHLLEGILYAAGWKPPVSATHDNGSVVLTWPLGPAFSAQSRSQLGATSWTSLTNPAVVVTNGQNTLRIPSASSNQFFRLVR